MNERKIKKIRSLSSEPSDLYRALRKKIMDLERKLFLQEKDLNVALETLNSLSSRLKKLISQAHQSLKFTQTVQKKLVPTEIPSIPDFEFSKKFIPGSSQGGNYHNIFEQKDPFCFGIVLAESTDYNTSALLLSLLLRFSGALHSKEDSYPLYIGQLFIREMTPLIQDYNETHFFYAKVDRRSFEMRYIQMGRSVGFVQKQKKNELIFLKSSLNPLQKKNFNRKDLKEKKIFLDAKDRLIFCTQGLLKVENKKGEEFGLKRLRASILEAPRTGVHELRNKILFDLNEFSQGEKPSHDLTILACEIKDRVIKLAQEE